MKKEVRMGILEKRKALCTNKVEELSKKINQHILNWDKYKDSNKIMVYMAFRNEVKTMDIIKDSFSKSKIVVLPKSIKETSKIIPCVIENLDELKSGSYGIMEPYGNNIADRDTLDIIFVPGVAFDRNGYRIGYGAGYYDRFLAGYKGIKAGICYEMQIVEDAFHDAYDASMDYLITEEGIIKITN